MKMSKITLRLEDEVAVWLHAEAARLKVDASQIVAKALHDERDREAAAQRRADAGPVKPGLAGKRRSP